MIFCFGAEGDGTGEAALLGQRAPHQGADDVLGQRFEGEQHAARQQRRNDREVRVLRRRRQQRDRTVLHRTEQRILLGLVEPVHLVDEQHGLPAAGAPGPSRCSCPISSSRVAGRIRTASGASAVGSAKPPLGRVSPAPRSKRASTLADTTSTYVSPVSRTSPTLAHVASPRRTGSPEARAEDQVWAVPKLAGRVCARPVVDLPPVSGRPRQRPGAGVLALGGRHQLPGLAASDGAAGEAPAAGGLGLTSMPASARCCGVIGVGAPVSGSYALPLFGNAITSRIDSTPVSSAAIRSQPSAAPPCGGGPYLKASSRKPNLLSASSRDSPITSNTRCWMSARWIRIEPLMISLPLQTMSYASASAASGSVSNRSSHSGRSIVNGWCSASQPPSSRRANIGKSTTKANSNRSGSASFPRRAISTRAAPSSDWASRRDSDAAKNTASPGFAPTASASPARCSAERFFATGPRGSPVSASKRT